MSNIEFYLKQANQMVDDALIWYECTGVSGGRQCGKCFSCACQEVLNKRGVNRYELMAHNAEKNTASRYFK
jgi:hypothetical protein